MWLSIIIFLAVVAIITRFKDGFVDAYIRLRFYIKMNLYYAFLTFISIIVIPFMLIRPRHASSGVYGASVMNELAKIIYQVEWHIRNKEILAEDRGVIIICNHQSALDVLGVSSVWPIIKKLAIIAKKELFYAGPLGVAVYLSGAIFIDRKAPKEAYKMLEYTTQIMKKNKTKIWIFPEGTRNTKRDGKLLPFKKGAFNTAVNAQVPIIPVVFSPYYFVDEDKYIFNKGHVLVQCLEPVSTVGLTLSDVPALIDRIHQIMSRTYEQLSKEVSSNTN